MPTGVLPGFDTVLPVTTAGLSSLRCAALEVVGDVPSLLKCGQFRFRNVLFTSEQLLVLPQRLWFFDRFFSEQTLFGCCALLCILLAALAAGLTLGLTSLEEFDIRVLCNQWVDEVATDASPMGRARAQQKLIHDQKCARRILPLISGNYFRTDSASWKHKLDPTNSHYLLVTLLLLNASANEALPLFLDHILPSWLACVVSVTVVLFFGEILPSAIFTGPRQLSLAAGMSPIVKIACVASLPIVWPISLLLDKMLGRAQDVHSRAHIKALIRTMRSEDSALELDEANMIHGVLEMHHKKGRDVSHPLWRAKMVPDDSVVTPELIDEFMHWGHSRIFVYRRDTEQPQRRDDIVGVLLVKKLLNVSRHANLRVGDLAYALKKPVVLSPTENLLSVLNKFQIGTCHLAFTSSDPDACLLAMSRKRPIPEHARPTLFCSLEDVIEAILKDDIYDEEDRELGRHMMKDRSPSPQSSRRMVVRLVGRSPREGGARGRSRMGRHSRSTPRFSTGLCSSLLSASVDEDSENARAHSSKSLHQSPVSSC